MARGWESKSVESQQDDARRTGAAARRDWSPEARDRAQRRATIELALAATQADLAAACRPAHRDMLLQRLEALKAELGTL